MREHATQSIPVWVHKKVYELGFPYSYVEENDRANDRSKLAKLAANVCYRYWLVMLTAKSVPIIGRELLPELRSASLYSQPKVRFREYCVYFLTRQKSKKNQTFRGC